MSDIRIGHSALLRLSWWCLWSWITGKELVIEDVRTKEKAPEKEADS
jgi:hypothetical protein